MNKLISWVEIPVSNFERAVDFYGKILNTEFNIVGGGEEKMACFPNGEGAISLSPGFNPSKNGVLVSFYSANDLDLLLDTVQKNGGKLVQGKTKIQAEGRGYFALILDSEGNRIGLYQD